MTQSQTHAWIFSSVPEQLGPLHHIIAVADAINHAVPTENELQVSLSWLLSRKLIRKVGKKYSLTEKGIALRNPTSNLTKMRGLEAIRRNFSKLPTLAVVAQNIPSTDIDEAYNDYEIQIKAALKK